MLSTDINSPRLPDDWNLTLLAAPLVDAAEVGTITDSSWRRIRVPGHWQLEDAFADYEGLMLYRCRRGMALSRYCQMLCIGLRSRGDLLLALFDQLDQLSIHEPGPSSHQTAELTGDPETLIADSTLLEVLHPRQVGQAVVGSTGRCNTG